MLNPVYSDIALMQWDQEELQDSPESFKTILECYVYRIDAAGTDRVKP